MFLKKILTTLALIPLALTGCNKEDKNKGIPLLGNFSSIYGESETKQKYFEGSIESFDKYKELNVPFLVYFTSDSCSKCENFGPIMDNYLDDHHPFVFWVNENLENFVNNYGDLFYKGDEITVPYVGVYQNGNCTRINNSKFMRTKNSFVNHMESNYHTSSITYLDEQIDLDKINKPFTMISYNNSDAETINLYKQKLANLQNSKKDIIISSYGATDLSIATYDFNDYNKLELKEKIQITNETESSLIDNFLF